MKAIPRGHRETRQSHQIQPSRPYPITPRKRRPRLSSSTMSSHCLPELRHSSYVNCSPHSQSRGKSCWQVTCPMKCLLILCSPDSLPHIFHAAESGASSQLSPPSSSSSSSYNPTQSAPSRASSFARFLRHNGPDMRLHKKKSQPPEHAKKREKPPQSQTSSIRRSPSFYKPKVIEDSALSLRTSAMPASPSQSSPLPASPAPASPTDYSPPPQPPGPGSALPASTWVPVVSPGGFIKFQKQPIADVVMTVQRQSHSQSPARSLEKAWMRASPKDVAPVSPTPAPAVPLRRHIDSSTSVPAPSASSPSPSFKGKRPALINAPRLTNLPKPPTIQAAPPRGSPPPKVRIEMPEDSPASQGHSHESKRGRSTKRTPPQQRSKAPAPRETKHYHDVTPPERDPTLPGHALLQHNDHYFRTFSPETMYMKVFTPTLVPPASDYFRPMSSPSTESISGNNMPLALRPTSPDKSPPASPPILTVEDFLPAKSSPAYFSRQGDTLQTPSRPALTNRQRSSIFKGSRKSDKTESTDETPNIGIASTGTAGHAAPDLHARAATLNQGSRDLSSASSEGSASYFARPRLFHTSIEGSSSLLSPLDTSEKLTRPRLQQSRSSSSQLSPLTQPKPKPRLRHQATLEDIDDTDVPAKPRLGPKASFDSAKWGMYKSADGKEHARTRLTGKGSLSWLPSEMRKVHTPPEEKAPKLPSHDDGKPLLGRRPGAPIEKRKRSIFKQVLHELRPASAVPPSKTTDSSEPRRMKRRSAIIVHKLSMSALLQKASVPNLNILKRKASEGTISPPRTLRQTLSVKPSFDMTVTNFEQTPFSQRYNNTQRAEKNQLRHWIDETVDDEIDDETQLGFEIDVPDHYPNSPLCPLHPKHKSGGNAICPLHRRKRQMPSPRAQRSPTVERTPTKLEPRIVFEGKVEAGVESMRAAEGAEQFEIWPSKRRRLSSHDAGEHMQHGDGSWYY